VPPCEDIVGRTCVRVLRTVEPDGMPGANKVTSLSLGGRTFTVQELEDIRATVDGFPHLTRKELACTLCENLRWFTAAGGYKVDACLKLLAKLSSLGFIQLPEKFFPGVRRKRTMRPASKPETEGPPPLPPVPVGGTLAEVGPISLQVVVDPTSSRSWKQAVDRYHYLGYKQPFGYHLRYFITSTRGPLGCVLLAGAAKSMGARDRWLGWTDRQRLRNLPWIVNNSRFLIFPWVQVKHLASHALGHLSRRVQQDWYARFGYRPVLLETFVDPNRYQGTCYRAAGWIELGRTTGEGLRRPGCTYSTTPKMIFVQPLVTNFRELLCSESLQGRVWNDEASIGSQGPRESARADATSAAELEGADEGSGAGRPATAPDPEYHEPAEDGGAGTGSP
jgi:hypothetical protein